VACAVKDRLGSPELQGLLSGGFHDFNGLLRCTRRCPLQTLLGRHLVDELVKLPAGV
jgi:hypothetical protein